MNEALLVLGSRARSDLDPVEQGRAGNEAERIEAECRARAPGDDEQAADRRAEDAGQVAAQPLKGVCLLQTRRADGLRHEPDLGRDDEPGADAVDPLQHDDRENRPAARENERRCRGLRRTLHERGAADHEVSRQPVGEDAAADEDERLDDLPNREDDPEVGCRADVEHGERERDPRQSGRRPW